MRIWRVAPFLACLFLSAIPAKASDRLPVVGPTDFHFTFSEPAQFTVRAYAIEFNIDSMLWLYDGAGNQVAANDDWFGLDSWLDVPLEAGVYRLRAGVCCGNPEAWYGQSYEVELNTVPVEPTTTTTSTTTTSTTTTSTTTTSTTTTVPETTTTEPTTTTSEPTTTTSEPVPTTTEPAPPIILPPPPETTWPTTTLPATTTTAPAPTSTEPAATLPTVTEPDSTEVPVSTNVATEDSASVPSVSETVPSADSTPPEPTPTSPSEPPVSPSKPSETVAPALPPAPPVDAPESEKRQFEEQVNIFAGGYDDYVPAGSTVTVAQRRTIVAATVAVSSVLPGPAPSRRRK